MGELTAGQVLAQVDSLLPNAYTREELPVPSELTESSVLTAGAPYDALYGLYVQAQIHYADGDTVRCGNAMNLWNRTVAAMQAALLREKGQTQAAGSLRFC